GGRAARGAPLPRRRRRARPDVRGFRARRDRRMWRGRPCRRHSDQRAQRQPDTGEERTRTSCTAVVWGDPRSIAARKTWRLAVCGKSVSVTLVLLAVLLVGHQLVLVGFDLPFPRVAHRGRAPLVGAKRKTRNQAVEILAPTRGTFHGWILRP